MGAVHGGMSRYFAGAELHQMTNTNTLDDGADSDLLHFVDDEGDDAQGKLLTWRLLVVDDEPDVHRATTFALAGVSILGRPLEFLHAYSAVEATELLKRE